MPLTRINTPDTMPEATVLALAELVYQTMRQQFEVPEGDRFQIIERRPRAERLYDRKYFGVVRSDDWVLLEITAKARPTELKRAFVEALAQGAADLGHRPEDLMIVITETAVDCWSFGNGKLQMLEARP